MTTETTGAVSAALTGQDTLQKFIFDNAAVRGQFIDVSGTWQEVVSRHAYPTAVKKCWAKWWRPPPCCRPT